jgi:hypothetical protein
VEDRIRRARAVAGRLASLGVPVDVEWLIARAEGKPVLRPHIAQALVDAGHVDHEREAFDRYIGENKPAYVPRQGATPAEVIAIIRKAGGISAMAHPGVRQQAELIPDLAAAGLDALEVYHTDHSAEDAARYAALARRFGVAVTGGSDFHGFGSPHSNGFGTVHLPAGDFEAFRRRRRE